LTEAFVAIESGFRVTDGYSAICADIDPCDLQEYRQMPFPTVETAALSDQEHLSAYELYVLGDTIVWVDPRGAAQRRRYVGLVKRPGQEYLSAVMEQILEPFRTETGKVLALPSPLPRISVDPEVLGGFPVIAGTRVPYDLVAGLVRDGVPPPEVRAFYPSVDAAGALDAEAFASYVDRYRTWQAA